MVLTDEAADLDLGVLLSRPMFLRPGTLNLMSQLFVPGSGQVNRTGWTGQMGKKIDAKFLAISVLTIKYLGA